MSYRGPKASRVGAQFNTVQGYAGEPVIWREFISGATAAGSGQWGGVGTVYYYREQAITGLLAAPQMGESRFRETQLPGGQVIAGDAVISMLHPLGQQDELVWRGVTYRVEGDSTPIHLGGRLWYRTVLRRGDVTG